MSGKPLDGLLVIALEQAVAAPLCSSRLADAGARVIKIERPEGDFARGYDTSVHGESSYFVWINRGKESVVLDLRQEADKAQLHDLIAAADVFIQNLAPGAAGRLGFGSELKFPQAASEFVLARQALGAGLGLRLLPTTGLLEAVRTRVAALGSVW